MPIHLRAEPGDYADGVLCPGDPRRAEHLAHTLLTDARLVNDERGLLGFTGTFEGQPLSVQTSGMGAPSASIVYEELIALGAKRLIRIGTAGALQPGVAMADLIIAISATPSDQTAITYTGGEPHAPTADWRLAERAVAEARARGIAFHVGPIVTSDVFYDPDRGRLQRWASRGHLGVEMEAAALFTIAAIRGVSALAMMTVSDTLYGDQILRVSDEELKTGVDTMMAVAATVAVAPL